MRLLGQFYFFYDKISQVQKRIKTQVQVFYILNILGFFQD